MPSIADLSQVYLAAAHLVTHEFRQDPPFTSDTNVQVKYERPRADTLEIWARYVTNVSTAEEDPAARTPVWTIEVECVAEYELAGDAQLQDLGCEAFAVLVGAPAIHPYAREWTQSLSSQSRYPALTLGLMGSLAEMSDDHVVEFPDFAESEAVKRKG